MYDVSRQDVHSGGSGCGCSGSIIAGRICKEMREGKIKRAMLVSTGALDVDHQQPAGRVDSGNRSCGYRGICLKNTAEREKIL